MLLPTAQLFVIATGHVGVVIALLLYSILTLLNLTYCYVTAQEAYPKLNVMVPVAVLVQGCSSFLLMLHGYWLLFFLDLLILRWAVYQLVKHRKKGVYETTSIENPEQISKYIRRNYICLVYFGVCLIVYVQRAYDGLKTPIDWGAFDLPKTLFFITTLCLTEAVLIILAYSIVLLLNIELDDQCAQYLCSKLNRLLIVKTIVHGVLSCVLLAHTSMAFFVSNLQILRWEMCRITSNKGRDLGVYDPENILRPGEIQKHRNYYRISFLYFCICLGVYTYCMLVGKVGVVTSVVLVFLPMLLLEVYEMLNVEGGILGVIGFFFLLTSGQLRNNMVDWVCFIMYIVGWCFVIGYCAYLANWQLNWLKGEDREWILYLLIDIVYELCVMIDLI